MIHEFSQPLALACLTDLSDRLVLVNKQHAAIFLCAVTVTHRFTACSSVLSPAAPSFTPLAAGPTSKRGRTQRGAGLWLCVWWEYEGASHSSTCHTHTTRSVSHSQINYFQLSLGPLMPNKAMGCLWSLCWLCVSEGSLTAS